MTKDELKKQLHRYRDLEAERQQIALELKRVEDFMDGPRGANLDGMPKAPGIGDPVLGVVSQHLALQERYRLQLEKLAAAQSAIEDVIESLEPIARKLMRHRYIEGLTWEEVCVAIGYSWRQTHNIHAKALDTLLAAEMEKDEPKAATIMVGRIVEERTTPEGESLTVAVEPAEDPNPCSDCEVGNCWRCLYGAGR